MRPNIAIDTRPRMPIDRYVIENREAYRHLGENLSRQQLERRHRRQDHFHRPARLLLDRRRQEVLPAAHDRDQQEHGEAHRHQARKVGSRRRLSGGRDGHRRQGAALSSTRRSAADPGRRRAPARRQSLRLRHSGSRSGFCYRGCDARTSRRRPKHALGVRHDGIGMDDQHRELADCGLGRQPILLLCQSRQRRFSDLEVRHLAQNGALGCAGRRARRPAGERTRFGRPVERRVAPRRQSPAGRDSGGCPAQPAPFDR